MGCDIHIHAEVKINDRWEHVCEVDADRSYQMFADMVDGHPRSRGEKGIAPKRGLPDDINPLTFAYLKPDEDYHTHSYLSGEELRKIGWLYEELDKLDSHYLWQLSMNSYSPDFRLVFCFDN